MSDDRKALHELIDQAPEEALPRLFAWLTRLLHPPGSSEEGGMITFFPTEPGTTTPEPTDEAEKERRVADYKVKEALKDERPIQDRRVTDVKAKLAKLLADVDLLVLPRYTITTVTTGRETRGVASRGRRAIPTSNQALKTAPVGRFVRTRKFGRWPRSNQSGGPP